jgi:hypothetical protein
VSALCRYWRKDSSAPPRLRLQSASTRYFRCFTNPMVMVKTFSAVPTIAIAPRRSFHRRHKCIASVARMICLKPA